jgi:hypothetical protein
MSRQEWGGLRLSRQTDGTVTQHPLSAGSRGKGDNPCQTIEFHFANLVPGEKVVGTESYGIADCVPNISGV